MRLGPYLRKKHSLFHEFLRRVTSIIDYVLWLLFDPSKYTIIKNRDVDKILIVLIYQTTGNIGGNFCALGVANYFKALYPKVKLSFLLDKKSMNQFGKVPGIEMIEYKGKDTIGKLKEKGFKAAFLLHLESLKTRDFKFVPYRLVLSKTNVSSLISPTGKLFITRKVLVPRAPMPNGTHMVNLYFKLFEALGFRFKEYGIKFFHTKKEESKINQFLRKNKIKKFIIIHPGGKHVVRILKEGKISPFLWPLDRYSKVAKHFMREGYKILVTGAPDESYLVSEMARLGKLPKKSLVDCCGKFSFREVGALLKKASALVSTDTSIVHLAYQVKTPITELMGPSRPDIYGPWPLPSKRHIVLFDTGPCSLCQIKMPCPENKVCMARIKVDDVIKATEQLLKKRNVTKSIRYL